MADTTTARARMSRGERIAQLKARIEKLQAVETKASRRRDTREKIILGGTVRAAMQSDPQLRAQVLRYLHQFVQRPTDRDVIAHWLAPR